MLENELDEKQRMGDMCQRLKDEVRGTLSANRTGFTKQCIISMYSDIEASTGIPCM